MFISKYMNSHKQEIVTEGWGVIAGFLFGPLGILATSMISEANMRKLLNHPKLKKYVIANCDKLYKKACKEYPKYKVSTNTIATFNVDDKTDDGLFYGGITRCIGTIGSNVIVGRYYLMIEGDTDHFRRLIVRFVLIPKPNTDLKVKAVLYTVPAPTKQDLIDLGFRDTFN